MSGLTDLISIGKDQLLSLFDFENPFSIYFWVLVIGFSFRFFLVLRPLYAIYKRHGTPKQIYLWKIPIPFTKPKLINTIRKANVVKKETSLTGIEQFLAIETMLAIAPTLSAGVLRLSLGSPTISDWTPIQMYILFGVFAVWLAYYIRRSVEIRKSLKKLNRWYADPRLVNTALSGMTLTKRGLVRLTKLEIPDYREEEEMILQAMRPEDEEGNKSVDGKAVLHNAKEIGTRIATKAVNFGIATKSASKSLAERGSQKLDEVVQEKVEEIISLETGRIVHFIKSLLVVFGPLIVIYSLPYSSDQIFDVLLWW
tara:strand:- start:815 stop:1750 length:936 start_codon:yes stop_codon:yes gene_type:complete